MERKPAVAGQFYESTRNGLSAQVDRYIKPDLEKKHAIGIISPHAGLMYSGLVAGEVYSRLKFPHSLVLIGPNHTGLGSMVSIMSSGTWSMPTGQLEIDEKLANSIKEASEIIEEDSLAHQMEHSLEVQLPFIIHFTRNVKIVPVSMMTDSVEVCRTVGEAVGNVLKNTKYPVTIIASSDMSHYVDHNTARTRDRMAIERIVELNPEGLFETVKREGISMCGVAPATTMLFASRILGATSAELVKYMTSGEVSGDYDYVVGYAGVIVY